MTVCSHALPIESTKQPSTDYGINVGLGLYGRPIIVIGLLTAVVVPYTSPVVGVTIVS